MDHHQGLLWVRCIISLCFVNAHTPYMPLKHVCPTERVVWEPRKWYQQGWILHFLYPAYKTVKEYFSYCLRKIQVFRGTSALQTLFIVIHEHKAEEWERCYRSLCTGRSKTFTTSTCCAYSQPRYVQSGTSERIWPCSLAIEAYRNTYLPT